MSRSKFVENLLRAKRDLDIAVSELSNSETSDLAGTVSKDLLDIRARVAALEARVDVIEERGER